MDRRIGSATSSSRCCGSRGHAGASRPSTERRRACPALLIPSFCIWNQRIRPFHLKPGDFDAHDAGCCRIVACWHQTLKNRILLENYYRPGDLEAKIGAFVANYDHLRYHESIANLTPADVSLQRFAR